MFRFLLMITSLLSGLALAQLTRDREAEEAPGPADAPAEEGAEDSAEALVAVMAEQPAPESTLDEPVEANAVTTPIAEPIAAVEIADDVSEPSPGAFSGRPVRALLIAGVAAIVGLGLGYLALRRVRPDLLANVSLAAIRPGALPTVDLRVPVLELHLPDIAEVRRTRLPALDTFRVNASQPAVRSAVASVVASALATSLVNRFTSRR